jgi:hypothetical protein
MSRTALIIGFAIVVTLVIAQAPGWTANNVSNTDGAGITSVAQHSQHTPGMTISLAGNDDPPRRGGDDPPPHG